MTFDDTNKRCIYEKIEKEKNNIFGFCNEDEKKKCYGQRSTEMYSK